MGENIKKIMNSGRLISDQEANDLVVTTITESASHGYKGILLDGYPRTVSQAQFFDTSYAHNEKNKFVVVNIKLNNSVAVAKLLGRRLCKTCGGSFNTADIMTNGYDMPAILPDIAICILGSAKCKPDLVKRDDDTEETILTRIEEHDKNSAPIIEYYENKHLLKSFDVHKGVKDVDALIKVILNN